MSASVLDPCLFSRKDEHGKFEGTQAVLVDDTIGTGSISFADNEKLEESFFEAKPRMDAFPMRFNGIDIELQEADNNLLPVMKQTAYSKSIRQNVFTGRIRYSTRKGCVCRS